MITKFKIFEISEPFAGYGAQYITFGTEDYVKRKRDGVFGKILYIERKDTENVYYYIDFNDGLKKYKRDEIVYPTREELQLYLDATKYNL